MLLSFSMVVDTDGTVWFEDTLSGEVKKLDMEKGVFRSEFMVTPASGKWRKFDSEGKYWASQGLSFTEIELRRPDNSRLKLKLEEGFRGERIIWNEPKSWILARNSASGSSQLFELDMNDEVIRNDRQLDQNDVSIADIIPYQGKRLALVRELRVNGEDTAPSAQLKLYEDNGRKWVEWDKSLQPKWADWHSMTPQEIIVKDSGLSELRLFHADGVIWIAGTGFEAKIPILARMPLETKKWTRFYPGAETVKSPVTGFWLDRQNRLVLTTAAKLFYYNPTSSKQETWMSVGP